MRSLLFVPGDSPKKQQKGLESDADALILHSENMAPLMESIMATGSVSGELLGDLGDELRAQMAGSPVGLFTLYQSL